MYIMYCVYVYIHVCMYDFPVQMLKRHHLGIRHMVSHPTLAYCKSQMKPFTYMYVVHICSLLSVFLCTLLPSLRPAAGPPARPPARPPAPPAPPPAPPPPAGPGRAPPPPGGPGGGEDTHSQLLKC